MDLAEALRHLPEEGGPSRDAALAEAACEANDPKKEVFGSPPPPASSVVWISRIPQALVLERCWDFLWFF